MASELDLEAVMAANQTAPGKMQASTAESEEWTEIRGIIEDHITNQPRSLQKEIGPSELGTDCLHCLAARLAGWEKRQSPHGCHSSAHASTNDSNTCSTVARTNSPSRTTMGENHGP